MMAGKTGMGRLTFSGRQEYVIQAIGSKREPVYLPIAACELGNHYLMRADDGSIQECVMPADGETMVQVFDTYADAQAAIMQWQRQHAAAVATSGETPQE